MLVEFIKYLADEIKNEQSYNELYRQEMMNAEYRARMDGGRVEDYFNRVAFPRSPRDSIIRENKKMIRRLTNKL